MLSQLKLNILTVIVSETTKTMPRRLDRGRGRKDHPIQETTRQETTRQYRTRQTPMEKLDKVFAFLRDEFRWSLPDLIRTLCEQDDPKNRQRQTGYIQTAYSSEIIDLCASHPRSSELQLREMLLDSVEWGIPEYRQEVAELERSAGFGKCAVSVTDIDTLDGLLDTARENAPRLIGVFEDITSQSRRSSDRSFSSRYIIILAILYYTHSQRCNNVQTLLGLYLHSNGVHRRVVALLARCGISVSYDTVIQRIKTPSEEATMAVSAAANSSDSVTVYDNFEQMEGVKEQRIEDNSVFHSITTAEVFHGREIPDGGLTQSMLNKKARLEPTKVILAPGNSWDDIQRQV